MNGFLNKQPATAQLATLIGFFIAFFLIYFAVMQLLLPSISGGYTYETLYAAAKKDSSLLPYLKLTQILYTTIVFLVPAVIFLYLCYPQPFQETGLAKGPSIYNLVFTLLIMASALPLVAALMEWNASWPVGDTLVNLEKEAEEQTKRLLYMPNVGSLIVNLLMVAAIPALAEELFFRGAMQPIVTKVVRNGFVAVIITSVIFSAIHMQFLTFLPRFGLSIILGCIYLISGNLWLSIIAHFCNNALSVILFYSGQTETDESYSWYITALSGAVVLALFLMMRRSNKHTALAPTENN
ncbi:CPBP family intramembrane metalloprotease [Chitinophaga horti]|uniref:CPBP family intramembrane metalloprotease n=1 Tax=Chitinophaga horti TaxID=2920382 RepID=A0ABY6IZL3_9BACT|nr:type II CAAX endopeptidase family protein [Chitinophaga horti]UYQ92725.1 CPBP family intramembrane metalloprotease [Chitinophaga horti]